MQRGRYLACLLAIAVVVQVPSVLAVPGAQVHVTAPPPAADAAPDAVPERWVLGQETLQGQTATIAERIRVLPGARLDVVGSTLTFAAHASGPTGIVAEPGSEVRIVRSTLQAAAPGAFLLHLEGDSVLDASTVRGARAVVVQPRSLTDHVDDAAGAQLERQVLGWRAARTLTNGTALVRGTLVEGGTGPGLVAGVPVQYQASQPSPTRPAVRIETSVVRATAGPALLCYGTRQDPDPDFGFPIPQVAAGETLELALASTTLDGGAGVGLHCPPSPTARTLPARNLPLAPPDLAAPANALLPAPPAPEVFAGPPLVRMAGGGFVGQGTGALLDGSTRLDATGVFLGGLGTGVLVGAPTASARLASASGSGLRTAAVVTAGSLDVSGGDLAGRADGAQDSVGLQVGGGAGAVTVTGARVRDFSVGVAAGGPATIATSTLEAARSQCVKVEGTALTVRDSTLRGCGFGVHLIEATGATIERNAFLDNANPLRVDSAGPLRAHFEHTVAANTVHGKPLVYLVGASGRDLGDAGHAVIAFSSGVRVARLDLAHGAYQVVQSTDVVLGTLTDQQPMLLASMPQPAQDAFDAAFRGVQYEIYPGAMKGPRGAAAQGTGNDWDQAWMLVESLEALGHEARFVEGTAYLTEGAYKSWVTMADTRQAVSMWGWSGRWYGASMDMDRVWVEVASGQPGLWFELDPAFETYDYVAPPNLDHLIGWTQGDDYRMLMENTTKGDHWIQGMPVGQVADETGQGQQAFLDWAAAQPGLTSLDLVGGRKPRPVAPEEEPKRTPLTRFEAVPLTEQWKVRIQTKDLASPKAGEIDFQGTTALLFGHRLTLSSRPFNAAERAFVDAAGGIYNVSRSATDMTTTLWVDDLPVDQDGKWPVAGGLQEIRETPSATRRLGDLLGLDITVTAPDGFSYLHDSPFRVGGTYGVVLEIGRTTANMMVAEAERYQAAVEAMMAGAAVDHADLTGQLRQSDGTAYFAGVAAMRAGFARRGDIVEQPLVSAAMTGQGVIPVGDRVISAPPYLDVQSLVNAYARDGNRSKLFAFNFASGMWSSLMEDHVFTQLHNLPSVSTIKALNEANALGLKLYQINATNVDAVLAAATLPAVVENSIRSAVAAGRWAIAPHSTLSYLNWTGVGWIEYDPANGYAAWLIYGGMVTGTEDALGDAIIMSGGSGADWRPWGCTPRSPYDGGYADQPALEWSTRTGGAMLDTLGDFPVLVNERTLTVVERTTYYSSVQYGGVRYITIGQETRVLQSYTRTVTDPVGANARTVAKAGGWIVTGAQTLAEGYNIYTNPNDQRTMTQKHIDVGARAAYNVGSMYVAGQAAALGAKGGAALCLLGGPLGAVACGLLGGLAGGIGASLLMDRVKKEVFPEC